MQLKELGSFRSGVQVRSTLGSMDHVMIWSKVHHLSRGGPLDPELLRALGSQPANSVTQGALLDKRNSENHVTSLAYQV